MAFFRPFQNPLSTVMNALDNAARFTGEITGAANAHVASHSQNEPAMAQDYYPNRKHQNESVIPRGPSDIRNVQRECYIACRVVGGGFLGGQFARDWNRETAGTINTAPNPDHHWCVVVGDYLHQLQATTLNKGDNYYTNEVFHEREGGWKKFFITSTTYNDVAIRNASVEVMHAMPETYDLLNCNCQTFALRLLDRIGGGRKALLQGNRTYGSMAMPQFEPDPVTIVRVNEDGTETEVKPEHPSPKKKVIVPDGPKHLDVNVTEIAVGPEDAEVDGLSAEAKNRFSVLLDALKIMERETPTIEIGREG